MKRSRIEFEIRFMVHWVFYSNYAWLFDLSRREWRVSCYKLTIRSEVSEFYTNEVERYINNMKKTTKLLKVKSK